MHILVATLETQGDLPDDFSWTVDGELVCLPPFICANAECGWARSFMGLASAKATTTAMVVDSPLGLEEYHVGIQDGLVRQGYVDLSVPEAVAFAREEAGELLALAAALSPGTVVGQRDGAVSVRAVQPQGP